MDFKYGTPALTCRCSRLLAIREVYKYENQKGGIDKPLTLGSSYTQVDNGTH